MAIDVFALGKQYSNWRKWGADDERGTTNYITPEKLKQSAATVRKGKVFSLGIPFDANGPQLGPFRNNPVHLMSLDGGDNASWTARGIGPLRVCDDWVIMPLQCATQWDGLAHVYYGDYLYNGVSAATVTSAGAEKNSIDKQGEGIVSRGVLLDIARYKGVDWLKHGELITAADLDGAAAKQGVTIEPGDVVLMRTGWRTKYVQDGNRNEFMGGEPGIGVDALPWLYEKQIAAFASDNWAVEVLPGEDAAVALPVHCVAIRDIGLTLGEMFDLDALADDCAEDGVYEFQFMGPVLKVTGAVGSPINPLALK